MFQVLLNKVLKIWNVTKNDWQALTSEVKAQVITGQIPLCSAEGITIHKSQGSTLKKGVITISKNMHDVIFSTLPSAEQQKPQSCSFKVSWILQPIS